MNSKERILTTLNHEEPDKVPIDSWLVPEISNKLVELFNLDLKKDPVSLKVFLGDDLLYASSLGMDFGFETIYHPEKKIVGEENLYMDCWMCIGMRMNQLA